MTVFRVKQHLLVNNREEISLQKRDVEQTQRYKHFSRDESANMKERNLQLANHQGSVLSNSNYTVFTRNMTTSRMELKDDPMNLRNKSVFQSSESVIYNSSCSTINRRSAEQRENSLPIHDSRLMPLRDFGSNVLLFSAILGNTSSSTVWDRLSIQGWENRAFDQHQYICCVRYSSGIIFRYEMIEKNKRNFNVSWRATQFVCNVHGNSTVERPVHATLLSNTSATGCPVDVSMYLKIVYIFRYPNDIAAFEKIIYDNAPATDLLAWFEIHRAMGLGKAFIYPFRLNSNASRVLEYYQKLGLAEVIPFAFPTKDYYTKNLRTLLYSFAHYNHEDVAILDMLERVRGYKYLVSLDIDEYLIPTRNETWRTLFDRKFAEHPVAAGFFTDTYFYITDWGPCNTMSEFTVARFLYRTVLTRDRHKHVVIPSRVRTINTHRIKPYGEFTRFRLPEEEGAIRHYRICRGIDDNANGTCSTFIRNMDTHLADFFKTIKDNVIDIKRCVPRRSISKAIKQRHFIHYTMESYQDFSVNLEPHVLNENSDFTLFDVDVSIEKRGRVIYRNYM